MPEDPNLARELQEADNLPYGRARSARVELLTERAEQASDPNLLVWALLVQVASYFWGDEAAKAYVPFARLLRLLDEQPERFDQTDINRFLWSFKWMTSGMLSFPEISLDRIDASLDEMRRRYSAMGKGLNAVHLARFRVDFHTGAATAASSYERWQTSERDDMSDCNACEPTTRAEWHLAHQDDAAALRDCMTVIDQGLVCGHEPELAFALTLLPLVRSGDLDLARSHHIRGARLCRARRQGVTFPKAVSFHVTFCALTGNEARGLELLAQHQLLLAEPDTPLEELVLATAAALLLRRVVEIGHGDAPVTIGAVTHPAQQVADRLRSRALDLAGRFDARNGTQELTRETEATLALEPLVAELSLGVGPGTVHDIAPGRSRGAGSAGDADERTAGTTGGAPSSSIAPAPGATDRPSSPPADGEELDIAALVARAEDVLAGGAPDAAIPLALRAVLAPVTASATAAHAEAQLVLAQAYARAGRWYEAAEQLEWAAPTIERALPDKVGELHHALGSALAEIGEHELAAPHHLQAAAFARDHGDPAFEVECALLAATALQRVEDLDKASRVLDATEALVARGGTGLDAAARANLRRRRADLCAWRDEGTEAIALLSSIGEFAEADGVSPGDPRALAYEYGEAHTERARLLWSRGDLTAALAAADLAVDAHTRAGSVFDAAFAKQLHARVLLADGRTADGIEALRQAMELFRGDEIEARGEYWVSILAEDIERLERES